MSLRNHLIVLCLVLGTTSAIGCSEAVKAIKDLSGLQAELANQFAPAKVFVNLTNGHILAVQIENPNYDIFDAERVKEQGLAIANFTAGHYASIDSVDRIYVIFSIKKTSFLVFTSTKSMGPFAFKKAQTPGSAGTWEPVDPRHDR